MRYRFAVIALAVAAVVALGLVYASRNRNGVMPVIESTRLDSGLDSSLLIAPEDFDAVLSADELPPTSEVPPVDGVYWDKQEQTVLLEPASVQLLRDDTDPIIWHAWTGDGGCIIYATSTHVRVRRLSDGDLKTILSIRSIDRVYPSPNRGCLAVVSGRALAIVDTDGVRHGSHSFTSDVLSVAWHPGSSRLACSSGRNVWTVDLSSRPRLLKTYTKMKGTWDEGKILPVYAVNSLAWSASGRYLAYDVWTQVEKDWTRPHIVAYDTQAGTERIVREGYSEADGYFSWGPASDWMALCGSMGEPDNSVWVENSREGASLQCLGTASKHMYTSWRPGAIGLAVYLWEKTFSYTDAPVGSEYSAITRLMNNKNNPQITDLRKAISHDLAKASYTPVTPAESGIPDFDWSRDGSLYAFVERIYSRSQWMLHRENSSLPGNPLALLKIGSSDTEQFTLTWNGLHPAEPRFSADGTRVTFISDGSIMLCEIRTELRNASRASYWLNDSETKRASGDTAGAIASLRNSIRHDPTSPKAHQQLAGLYLNAARSDKNPYRKYMLLLAAQFEYAEGGSSDDAEWVAAHLREIHKALTQDTQKPSG